jgi:hypothetical protein
MEKVLAQLEWPSMFQEALWPRWCDIFNQMIRCVQRDLIFGLMLKVLGWCGIA